MMAIDNKAHEEQAFVDVNAIRAQKTQAAQCGIKMVIMPRTNLGDLMSTAVLNTNSITIQQLEISCEHALKEIFTTMLNCECQRISYDQIEVVPPGLSAIVGFGGKISGFIALHLSPNSACTLAEHLLGMNFTEVDEIVADAMGEIVNMLAGGVKKHMSENEDLFKISVPSIVFGNDYATHSPKNSEKVSIGVATGTCSFGVQLCFARR
jgi:chemotaxis protein CheX